MPHLVIETMDKPQSEAGSSCEALLSQLQAKIEQDYPEQAKAAEEHISALKELLSHDDSGATEKDVTDMKNTKRDPMSELMDA